MHELGGEQRVKEQAPQEVPRVQPQPAAPPAFAPRAEDLKGRFLGFEYNKADGIVGSFVARAEDTSTRMPLSRDTLTEHGNRIRKEMGGFSGGALESQARDTAAHFDNAERHMREGRTDLAQREYNIGVQRAQELRRMRNADFENQPEPVQRAMLSVWQRAGAGGEGWSDSLYSGVHFYKDNRVSLDSGTPGMANARDGLFGYITNIGERAAAGEIATQEAIDAAARALMQVTRPVQEIFAFIHQSDAFFRSVSQAKKDKEYLVAVKELEEEVKKLKEKMESGEASQDEKDKAAAALAFAKAAEEDLEGMPADARGPASAIYARGIRSMRAGKAEEARIQKTLAKRYAAEKDPERKEELQRFSRWLEEGKVSPADMKAMLGRESVLAKLAVISLDGKKLYEKEVADIRKLDREAAAAMKKADELRGQVKKLREQGKAAEAKKLEAEAERLEKRAKELLGAADRKTKGLVELASLERDLRQSGAPEPVLKAVRAAYRFYGTASEWRAKFSFAAAKLFSQYRDLARDSKGKGLFEALGKFIGLLAGPKEDQEVEKGLGIKKGEWPADKAKGLVGTARSNARALEAKRLVAGLEEAGAPKPLIDAVKGAAKWFGMKGQEWRGERIFSAARFFLRRKGMLAEKKNKGLLDGLLSFVASVAKPETGKEKADAEFRGLLSRAGPVPAGTHRVQPGKEEAGPAVAPQPPVEKPVQPVKFASLVNLRGRRAQEARSQAGEKKKSLEDGAKKLEELQFPAEILKGMRDASAYIGTAEEWKADMVIAAMGLIIKNKDTLLSPAGMQLLSGALSFMFAALEPGAKVGKDDADKFIFSFAEKAVKLAKDEREAKERALRGNNVQLLELSAKAPPELLPFIDKLAADNDARIAELKSGKNLGDDVYGPLMVRFGKLSEVIPALAELKESDPALYKDALAAYSNAFSAYDNTGDPRLFDFMIFAAEQILRYAGKDKASKAKRAELLKYSGAVAQAKSADETEAPKNELITYLSKSLSAEIDSRAGKYGKDTADAVKPLADGLGSFAADPAKCDISALARGRAALEMFSRMDASFARKMDADVRKGGLAFYNRALAALSGGGEMELAAAHGFLAEEYLSPGKKPAERGELESLSAGLASDASKLGMVNGYLQLDQKIDEYEKAAKGPPKEARAQMAQVASLLREYRTKIVNGESIATEGQIAAEGARIRKQMESDPDLAGKIAAYAKERSISVDDAIAAIARGEADQRKLSALTDIGDSIPKAFGRARGKEERRGVAEIYGYSIEALRSGTLEDAAMYSSAAAIYSDLDEKGDRQRVLGIARQYGKNEIEGSVARNVLMVYEQRVRYEGTIKDADKRRNASAYFDLALFAAWSGNKDDLQVSLELATGYAKWAALDAKSLGKDLQAKREDALTFVEGTLGDFKWLGRKRLADIHEDKFKPQEGKLNSAASAIIAGTPLADALGKGDLDAGISALEDISAKNSRHLTAYMDAERLLKIKRAEEFDKSRIKKAHEYAAGKQQDAERRPGYEMLAQYYARTKEVADSEFVSSQLGEARRLLEEGRKHMDEALRLKAEGDKAAIAGDKKTADGLYAQAASEAQTGDRMIRSSDAIVGGILSLEKGLKLNTKRRDDGWLDLGIGIRTYAAVGRGVDADEYGIVIMREGEAVAADERRTRQLAAQAESHAVEGTKEVSRQEAIQKRRDQSIARAKKEIHEVNLSNAEQIVGGIINLLPEGERQAYLDKLKWLIEQKDTKKLQELYVEVGLKAGVPVTEEAEYTKSKAFIENRINPLIELLPEKERQDYRYRVKFAFENGEMKELTKIYIELGQKVGPKSREEVFIYDIDGVERDYKRVVGLYWNENFRDGERRAGQAKFFMRGNFDAASYFIEERRFAKEAGSGYGGEFVPPGTPITASRDSINDFGTPFGPGTTDLMRSYEIGKMLISYMPPGRERDAELAKLEALYKKALEDKEAVSGSKIVSGEVKASDLPALTAKADKSSQDLQAYVEYEGGLNDRVKHNGRNVSLLLFEGKPVFFDAKASYERINQAKRMYLSGNHRGAQKELEDIELGARRDSETQKLDNKAILSRKKRWENILAAGKVEEQLLAPTDKIEDREERARAEDRNDAMGAVVNSIKGSYLRMANGWEEMVNTAPLDLQEKGYLWQERQTRGGWKQAEEAYLNARDSMAFGKADALSINTAMVGDILFAMPDSMKSKTLRNGKNYEDMANYIWEGRDERERNQRAAQFFQALQDNPEDFATIMPTIRKNAKEGLNNTAENQLPQWEAYASGAMAGKREVQSGYGRAYAMILARKMGDELALADSSQKGRKEKSRTMDKYYTAGPVYNAKTYHGHRNNAAYAGEAAIAATWPEYDYRFLDLLTDKTRIEAPIYQFKGSKERSWYDDQPLVVMINEPGQHNRWQWNWSQWDRRAISFGDELANVNRRMGLELSAYASADFVSFGYDRISNSDYFRNVADAQTFLELGVIGIRRSEDKEQSAAGKFAYKYEVWQGSREDAQMVSKAYEQFSFLRNALIGNTMGIDIFFAGDQNDYYMRVGERMTHFTKAAGLSMGMDEYSIPEVTMRFRQIKPLPGSYLPLSEADRKEYEARVEAERKAEIKYNFEAGKAWVKEGGTWKDSDEETNKHVKDMKWMQSAQNTTLFVVKMVRIAGQFAASPFTGGVSGAAAIAELTVEGASAAYEYYKQEGGWEYMSGKEKGFFGLQVVTTVLTPVLPGIGKWQQVRAAATEGVMILGAGETMTLTMGQRMVSYAGIGMIGIGTVQGLWNYKDILKAVEKGDMTWWEAAAQIGSVALPIVQTGLHSYRASVGMRTGIPAYRPKWLQTVEALTLGTPWDAADVHAVAKSYASYKREFRKLPVAERDAYTAYKAKRGVEFAPDAESQLIKDYRAARESGKATSFENYVENDPGAKRLFYEASYTALAGGRKSVSAMSDYEYVYAEQRARGASRDEAIAGFFAYEQSLKRSPQAKANEEAFHKVRRGEKSASELPIEQKAYVDARKSGRNVDESMAAYDKSLAEKPQRVIKELDEARKAEAQKLEREEQGRLGRELETTVTSIAAGEGGKVYTIGRNESAINYSEEHFSAAVGLVYYGKRYLEAIRGGAASDKAILNVPEAYRKTVQELAGRPEFADAAEGNKSGMMLRLALAKARDLESLSSKPEVAKAAYATEAALAIKDYTNNHEDLAFMAKGWREQAQAARTKAAELEKQAAASKGAEAELLKKGAGALTERASALESAASKLEAEAAKRTRPFVPSEHVGAKRFAELHPLERDGIVQVTLPDGTVVEKPAYHNIAHSENVAKMAYSLAMNRPFTENDARLFGSREEKATFLAQVGMLHDLDPGRLPGKAARVSATLEWMDSAEGKKLMKDSFGWDPDSADPLKAEDGKRKIAMAKAMIQRTEFPFDNAKVGEKTSFGFPRGAVPVYEKDANTVDAGSNGRIANRYAEKSPLALYEEYLSKMKPEEMRFVMEEAPILSEYADKSSWYVENRKTAHDSVKGLGTESPNDMFYGTSGFLKAVGQGGKGGSFRLDYEIAAKFGVEVKYPVIDEVLGMMGKKAKENWKANIEMFEKFAAEGNDARKQAKSLVGEDGKPLFDEKSEAGKKELDRIAIRAGQLAAGAEEVALKGDFPKDWNSNMSSYAAADPAKFAVAEYLFDAALRKQGIDPDKVRAGSAYGDRMLTLMTSDPAGMLAKAESLAGEMKPVKVTDVESGLKAAGVDAKSQIAEDARNWQKILRNEPLPSDKVGRYMDAALFDEIVRLRQEKVAAGKLEAQAEAEAVIEVSQRMNQARAEPERPAEKPVTASKEKIDEYKKSISGIKSDEQALSRIAEEDRMDPYSRGSELLKAAEGKLGLRSDVSKADVSRLTMDMSSQAADNFRRLTSEDSPFRERFMLADPTERAIIAEALANNRSLESAFELISKKSVPETRNGLVELSERYAGIKAKSEAEFNRRIKSMEFVDRGLADTLSVLADKDAPQAIKDRKIAEWERARVEAKRDAAIREAKANRTPGQVSEGELSLITGSKEDRGAGRIPPAIEALAFQRGRDPKSFQAELVKAYGSGGAEGKAAVLEKLGMLDNVLPEDRKTLVENLPHIFDLVFRGGLERQISSIRGYEGAKITGVSGQEGIMGTLKVDLVLGDGTKKSIFVKHIDLEADSLGANLAAANGMVTGKIHTTGADGAPLSYNTGIVYNDPLLGRTTKMQSYGFSEDIHGFAGSRVKVKMPGGKTEEVTVVSVAILGKEVMEPGKRAQILGDKNDPRYEAVRKFDEMVRDDGQREQILRAWHAYHELSRRSLLADRHGENTAVFVVDRGPNVPAGERYKVVFEPIDMDYVLKGSEPRDFNSDFMEKTDGFIGNMSRAWNIPEGRLYDQMIAEYKKKAFPDESRQDREAARKATLEAIEAHDGKKFGLGFDVSDSGYGIGRNSLHYGGRSRVIESADGRMTLYADEALPIAKKLNGKEAEGEFLKAQHDALVRAKESKEEGTLQRENYEEPLPPLPVESGPRTGKPGAVVSEKTTPGRRAAIKPSDEVTKPGVKVAAGAEGFEPAPVPKEFERDLSHSVAADLAGSPVKVGGLALALMKGEEWALHVRSALGDHPVGKLVDEMIAGKTTESRRLLEAAKELEAGRGSVEFAKMRAVYAKMMMDAVVAAEKAAPSKPPVSEPEISIVREAPSGKMPPAPPQPKIMSVSEAAGAFTGADQAARSQAINSFLKMDARDQTAVISELRESGREKEAIHLTEMQAISGEAGGVIAKMYGIDKGELVWIYSSAPDAVSARTLLMGRLGIAVKDLPWKTYDQANRGWVSKPYKEFNSPYEDNFIFGIITSGNLIGSIADAYGGAKIKSVEFRNGAVGAYEVVIETRRADGSAETRSVFVKRQDLRPDRAGSEYSMESGVPAPRVTTSAGGKDLVYTQPDGNVSRYGIIEDMKKFEGSINLGGVDARVKTVYESSIHDLADSPMLGWLNSADPKIRDMFWKELGYMLAGSYAVGMWDRHDINSRAMVLEITNPLHNSDPANPASPTVRDALVGKGYTVWDENGKTYAFMMGGIDTDTGAGYKAYETGGKYDMTVMNAQFGADLHRLFATMARIRGAKVEDLVAEAFGDMSGGTPGGPLGEGISRWMKLYGNDPKYMDRVKTAFASHNGEPAGFGITQDEGTVRRLKSGEAVHFEMPLSGDPYTLIAFQDGRSIMRADYEVVQPWALKQWDETVLGMFPPGRDIVLVEINDKSKGAVSDIGTRFNTIVTGDKRTVAIIDAADPAVAELAKSGVGMVRARRDIPQPSEVAHENKVGVIRGDAGMGDMLGVQASKAGAVPVFEWMMGAGEGFMKEQFGSIGKNILSYEDAKKKEAKPAPLAKEEAPLPVASKVPAAAPDQPTGMMPAKPVSGQKPVQGEINVPSKREEPKPGPSPPTPSWLEDLTAAAPPKFTPGKIVDALAAERHPDAKDALVAYSQLPIDAQLGVYREMHNRARKAWEDANALEATQPDAAAVYRENAQRIGVQAIRLGEVMALKGDVGRRLEGTLGLPEGSLVNAYLEKGTIEAAREEVAKRLGVIVPNYSDHGLFGMLITGDLAGVLRDLYPGAKEIKIESIGGGATGAYPVRVKDAAGLEHVEYVKMVDMVPDKAGAENLRRSGIPAPEVITTNKAGQPLLFMQPDGTVSAYGISRDIGEFSGTVKAGGREIKITTDKALPLAKMESSPEIMDIFINHPDAFWNEMGYMNAAGFAVGAVDGHEGNVFAMILDIKNPTKENIKALRDSGVYVFQDAAGDYKMFRLGRIDTDDSAGTYMAKGRKGKFDFGYYAGWTGEYHVFPRLLPFLTRVKNQYEATQAGTWRFDVPAQAVDNFKRNGWEVKADAAGYFIDAVNPDQVRRLANVGLNQVSAPAGTPRFVSVHDMVAQGMDGGKGQFYKGMKRWFREHDNADYRKAMEDGFRSKEGQSAGVSSFKLKPNQMAQLARDGVTYMAFPNNGENNMPVFYYDGRTRLMADYEKVNVIAAAPEIAPLFPQSRLVFVAPVSKKEAAGMSGTFKVGRKYFAVFTSYDAVPVNLRGNAVPATGHHGIVRAAPGFGKLTGLKTERVGAVQVFDYIMDMGERGIAKEWRKIEKMFVKHERKLEEEDLIKGDERMKRMFVNQRMPLGFGPDAYPPKRSR
ncbi:MAG: hypothetical protein AB1324_01525 [Candidatus Micrarchaeota archaeon]